MEILSVRALRGPNLWCRQPAIEAIVGCTEAEGGIAHTLTDAALRLQTLAGCPVAFSRTAPTTEPGVYRLVIEYTEEAVGRLAFDLAHALCLAAMVDEPFDLSLALARLSDLNEDIRLGPSTNAIVQAAIKRNIPYRRLTEGSLVQFGWGVRQRRIQAAETDGSAAIAEAIAQDKSLTKMLLAVAGVPVPDGRCVQSAEDAWAAALEIGAPLVVKPQDGNQGRGVTVNIQGREHVMAAYDVADANGSGVMVERYFRGHDYRLLVVGNRLVAAARRDPPQVIGDGQRSIVALVTQINSDPLRGEGHNAPLTKIRIDDVALATLAAQGYDVASVPAMGVQVALRNNANLSTGGTATDVTDHVHPDFAACAVAAAQMVGLDVCGIDLISQNVSQSLDVQSACIVEVNAAPGLRMHLSPSFGEGRAVGEAIIDAMFTAGDDGRIPLVAVTGTNGKTTTVRLIAHLIAHTGRCVGMTNSDGVTVGDQCVDTGDCSGPRSARNVLLHPDVEVAVLETARGGILREGLGFDRCSVAVVTNIGAGDHLGLSYISTVEDLAAVKRVVVENVAPEGMAVLNAADPIVAAMAANCPGQVTFFAWDRQNTVLALHKAKGMRVVYIEAGDLVLAQGQFKHRIALANIPLTRKGTIGFQVENAMAAVAAAWALDLAWEDIEAALASFVNDARTAPGRFNVYDYRGATLIADYGHNSDAIYALTQAVESMPASRRSVVISGAGDRRDIDIRRQTEILGDAFDEVILYQDMCQRGRADGEVLALLREGLCTARRTVAIQEIRGEFLAIDTALAPLQKGDLCLILVDQVNKALAHIEQRVSQG
ncbi:cyanophycin synthetase [Alcaligenaceae bacterium CGII-47]|nr:cyanophycin synthetase [Alcaligenaceae bacterium CGII-47]